jgi:hypothetical protein
MRYHVLLEWDRPHPLYAVEADDDEAARRLVAEKWPDDRIQIVREEHDRLLRLSDGAVTWFPL